MKKLLSKQYNNIQMQTKKDKGFTLAELLIVVAIIAILVAISIPIFSGKLEEARNRTDAYNAKAIAHAIIVYYMSDTEHQAEIDAAINSPGYHNVQVSVSQNAMNANPSLVKPIVDAGIVTDMKVSGHTSTQLLCQSKKKWDAYYVVFRLDESGMLEVAYCGRPVGPGNAFVAHSWGYWLADKTDFGKMAAGAE